MENQKSTILIYGIWSLCTNFKIVQFSNINTPFPHSTFIRTNNRTRTRLGWTYSYVSCMFVHPDLHSAPLFAGIRERSIVQPNDIISHLHPIYDWQHCSSEIVRKWGSKIGLFNPVSWSRNSQAIPCRDPATVKRIIYVPSRFATSFPGSLLFPPPGTFQGAGRGETLGTRLLTSLFWTLGNPRGKSSTMIYSKQRKAIKN